MDTYTATKKQEMACGIPIRRSCSLGGFEDGRGFIHKVPSSIALNTNHIKPNSFMHRAETIDEPFSTDF
jgi:hypothetical protein